MGSTAEAGAGGGEPPRGLFRGPARVRPRGPRPKIAGRTAGSGGRACSPSARGRQRRRRKPGHPQRAEAGWSSMTLAAKSAGGLALHARSSRTGHRACCGLLGAVPAAGRGIRMPTWRRRPCSEQRVPSGSEPKHFWKVS
ncbi:unnamed protein product [Prorocentrum cordatum]|uniref:Uncharacterized protein n=1 Tax=Prorocentrum cordatum TaxID=2364126 RepID=A0ABN9Y6X6_9DINO|nr:unnamed protein product [Polarella glacialis]